MSVVYAGIMLEYAAASVIQWHKSKCKRYVRI